MQKIIPNPVSKRGNSTGPLSLHGIDAGQVFIRLFRVVVGGSDPYYLQVRLLRVLPIAQLCLSIREQEKEVGRLARVTLRRSLQMFLLKGEDELLHLMPKQIVLLIKAGEIGSIPVLFLTSVEACLCVSTRLSCDQEENKEESHKYAEGMRQQSR